MEKFKEDNHENLFNQYVTQYSYDEVHKRNYKKVEGTFFDRINNFKQFQEDWSNPEIYIPALKDTPNDIIRVIDPSVEDYMTALLHGAKPEFIKISDKDLNDYIEDNPHLFL